MIFKTTKKMAVLAAALALTVAAQGKSYSYESVKGDPMKARIYTLDNGLKVYLSVNREKPRIQTYIAVKTGSRNDPAETTGLSHYLEHLMFKGSTHFGTTDYDKEKPLLDAIEAKYETYRTLTDKEARKACYREIDSLSQLAARYNIPNEYDKMMNSIGAQGTNAYTSNDQTVYVENIPSNAVEKWLQVEAERFQNMVIRGFHTELEAVYEEYNLYSARDNEKFTNAIFKMCFPGHPYGTQTTIGLPEHLKNPSITNIKNYFKRYYVPNNMAICMAGDFDPDQTIALIDRYFGQMKPNASLKRPEYPAIKPQTAVRDTTVWGQEAEQLALGWRFKGAADLQNDTLEVISKMLANGKAGLMELELEQQMKAQAVMCFNMGMHDYTGFVILGVPANNQKLEELRSLIIGVVDKLKRGDFSDDLLPSVVSNMKLSHFKSLLDNDSRASAMADAYLMDCPWSTDVGKLSRIAGITKAEIVDFANRHFGNNYCCVYKKQGKDVDDYKIEKPAITPIAANRDLSSQWLDRFMAEKMDDIQPRFVDFKRDMKVTAAKNLPLLYKQNTDDGLFELTFYYDFGTEDVKGLDLARAYLYYIGTDKKTSAQIKQEFYRLACDYSLRVTGDNLYVTLSGLNENLPKALALLEDFLKNAKADTKSYSQFVELTKKSREDEKTDQNANFGALQTYGIYGPYNAQTNTWTNEEMAAAAPQTLPDMFGKLNTLQHEVLYFGPYTEKEIAKLLGKLHKTPKRLAAVPQGKPYTMAETPASEVWIAPYDAKNIYMMRYHNENRKWNAGEAPVQALFNEYYGGSMNSVTFQELREARALAYSASANYASPRKKGDPEMFYTFIISQNDKLMDCVTTFDAILDTVPQSQAAFDVAKDGLRKTLASRRVTRASVLYSYLNARRRGLDCDLYERIYNSLPSVTLKDIVDFEQRNMAHKPLRTLILGDEKQLDMKALEKVGPVKRLTREEIFGY